MTAITCDVCPRQCKLGEGETGYCNVRKNENGKSINSLHGLFAANPENHNHTGTYALVLAGCNMKCPFCDVPFISNQFHGDTTGYRRLSEQDAVEKAAARAGGYAGCPKGLLAYFGGECGLHWEFILKASELCRQRGILTKLYTNGFINEPIMEKLAKVVDKISIGVKCSMSSTVYKELNADPAAVLRSIKIAWENCPDVYIRDLVGTNLEPTIEDIHRFDRLAPRQH